MQRWDDSLLELTKSTLLNDDFADAHASIGAMWIQRRDGITGAQMSFNKALTISSDFSLAHNGVACTDYVLGKWEEANDRYYEANKLNSCDNSALTLLITRNLNTVTLSSKLAKFPFHRLACRMPDFSFHLFKAIPKIPAGDSTGTTGHQPEIAANGC